MSSNFKEIWGSLEDLGPAGRVVFLCSAAATSSTRRESQACKRYDWKGIVVAENWGADMRLQRGTQMLTGTALSVVLAVAPAATSVALNPAAGPLVGDQTVAIDVPAPPAPPKFVRISGGNHSSLAIGDDGRVYGWGGNGDDEIGAEESGSKTVPVRSQTPAGVTFNDVAFGTFTAYAVGSDGKTYAWGSALRGALGNGSSTGKRSTPEAHELPGATQFTKVFAGDDLSMPTETLSAGG